MFALRARYDIIRSLWSGRRRSAASEHAFDVWCRTRFDAYATLLLAAALVMTLPFWLIDLVGAIRGSTRPSAASEFMPMRAAVAVVTLIHLFLPRTRLVRRYIVVIFAVLTGAGIVVAVAPFSSAAGPAPPHVYLAYSVLTWTIGLPMRLRARLALDLQWGACLVIAIMLPRPADWTSPVYIDLWVQTASLVALSVALGQFVQFLYRKMFFQLQALARHGEVLEDAVSDRTREVRRLVAHIATVHETERARIARDLHDDVGQEVAALRYAVAHTKRRYATAPDAIAPNLVDLEDLVSRATSSMQGVMAELRPRILDDLGFIAAAKWLAARTAERSSIACAVEVHGTDDGVDPASRVAAFRILQEALTNVTKHAAAAQATVTIEIGPAALDLTIADDGNGMPADPSAASADRPAGGMGLLSMRERAHCLGGSLVVGSRPGGGVEVRCRLPLPASAGASDSL